jgi:hypothetical protein
MNDEDLRDFFAGLAMFGVISSFKLKPETKDKEIAQKCYAMADAMLEAREGKKK